MWQVLLAATIAGSGYLANKHIIHKIDKLKPPVENADAETSIFRFSSVSNGSMNSPKKSGRKKGKTGKKFGVCLKKRRTGRNASKCDLVDAKDHTMCAYHGSKNSRKKLGHNDVIKGNKGNNKRKFDSKKNIGDKLVDDRMKSGKKLFFRLRKRRISRNACANCDSFDVKNKSSFGYGVGVGVGIMYMISAGKAEINRLNIAVDETAKVVQELKAEISKRKSSCDFQVENPTNHKRVDMKSGQSSFENNDIEVYSFPTTDVVEMDQLEAELESELLKLQVSTTDISSSFQNKSSTEDISKQQDLDFEFNKCNGVMPFELDQKLSRLLIEQHESQIVDLESELQLTNSKLVEKESELQALKDCVKRLTDFSLTCPSDGEIDEGDNKTINCNGRSMVGIKRGIDFD